MLDFEPPCSSADSCKFSITVGTFSSTSTTSGRTDCEVDVRVTDDEAVSGGCVGSVCSSVEVATLGGASFILQMIRKLSKEIHDPTSKVTIHVGS